MNGNNEGINVSTHNLPLSFTLFIEIFEFLVRNIPNNIIIINQKNNEILYVIFFRFIILNSNNIEFLINNSRKYFLFYLYSLDVIDIYKLVIWIYETEKNK